MFVLEARASLALRDPMALQAEMGEMGEMASKETPDLQAPRAPREECQAFPGVMGRKDHLAPLVSVETKENLVKEALQGFQLLRMRSSKANSATSVFKSCSQRESSVCWVPC